MKLIYSIGENGDSKGIFNNVNLQELSFISLLNNFLDQSSPLSNNAAKLPLTTFGDIGELASNKLAPKLLFQLRVSMIKHHLKYRRKKVFLCFF